MFTDEELDAMYPNILHQSESHHDSEDQGTSEKHGVAFDQQYVELKAEIAEVYNKKL